MGSPNINDIVPAMLKHESDMTLLDVPDVLLALEIWPGQIRVIGPISGEQRMAAGFRKDSPELRAAFNSFLTQIKQDGTYMKLVKKYFRAAPRYLPEFFKDLPSGKK
ncbi:transporter substrate-binding domain-containing protein [Zoogloea sp.]|uniref:transporter substrate-binding domain-containing protein n=1 Tax=Zoogloea sp. TaxID=49181 RepID=UPI00260BB029|nr:transporter substrate-binding domain-containing protein [Zoogloea sp.]